jgi:hypothetical protein
MSQPDGPLSATGFDKYLAFSPVISGTNRPKRVLFFLFRITLWSMWGEVVMA